MTETLRNLLPTLYGPRLPDLFDRPRVEEPRATCSDCAMCDKGAPSPSGLRTGFFHPEIKCCTYHPTLPNYLVGAALGDTSEGMAVGRERLRKKLVARIGVTPGWLAAPRKQNVLFEAARDTSFGRAESLVCPYYVRDGGKCSIWLYREAICATFFCKHASGQAGRTFWMALKKYMIHVERTLARWAVTAVDPDVIEPDMPMNKLTQEDLEDRPPPSETYERWWRGWVGREEEFYKECTARVQALTADELTALVGEDGRELLAVVTEHYQAVTEPHLAPRLQLNPDMPVNPAAADGSVAVIPYSRYDPLVLTQDLYLVLQQFSGREDVSEVIARIFREHEVEVPEALVLSMQQFGVMVPVEPDLGP
jgi:hypothetical protein